MSEAFRPQGPLTLDTVARQVGALDRMPAQVAVVIDLSGVTETDSSAVALLLAWCRSANARGQSISLQAVPDGLRRLIAVYGLTELLPLAA